MAKKVEAGNSVKSGTIVPHEALEKCGNFAHLKRVRVVELVPAST